MSHLDTLFFRLSIDLVAYNLSLNQHKCCLDKEFVQDYYKFFSLGIWMDLKHKFSRHIYIVLNQYTL